MKNKILVGLSGGVDSAVAALLLKERGFEVIGAIMSIWDDSLPRPTGEGHACLGPEEDDIESASAVARALGIEFHVLDCREQYRKIVLENFRSEYAQGRTPNPCVWCNSYIKFGALPVAARKQGLSFSHFATGHYASVERGEDGIYRLKKAKDAAKDQTYFIYRLNQKQLSEIMFPLGGYLKTEVRELAKNSNLPIHDKPDSQDFYCGDYGDILKFPNRPGDIVDKKGAPLGRHNGIWNYTIGKRKGLGISGEKEPLYVARLDAKNNRVIVGPKSDLYSAECAVENVVWPEGKAPGSSVRVLVKIRQAHIPAEAEVFPAGSNAARVVFKNPQMSVTPGQSAVFYQGDTVLGGGIIA
ncbi:MAG: tRNA 2-thiouridine(34) synthase MnmA [Elusimicrobiaceae bacterium]